MTTPVDPQGGPALLACPWGCKPHMRVSPSEALQTPNAKRMRCYWVECIARVSDEQDSHIVQTEPFPTRAEAIAAWHRRAPQPAPSQLPVGADAARAEGRRQGLMEALAAVESEYAQHEPGRYAGDEIAAGAVSACISRIQRLLDTPAAVPVGRTAEDDYADADAVATMASTDTALWRAAEREAVRLGFSPGDDTATRAIFYRLAWDKRRAGDHIPGPREGG